jgi:hypothetical protein
MSGEDLLFGGSTARKDAVAAHLIELGVLDDALDANAQTIYEGVGVVERPISSSFFVNEQRTLDEIAALEVAYRAAEESQDTQE